MKFRSQLENIMTAEELRFESTAGFGSYKKYLSHAIAHPAKMNMNLLRFLIQKHTKEGDLILDPMAGTGSTGVIAALNGRNAVCVELERKFYDWMEKARENLEASSLLRSKGKMRNVLGDARSLNEVLTEADMVITSPPYAEVSHHSDDPKDLEHLRPNRKSRVAGTAGYNNKENIGNLPFDAVITSPPYSESISEHAGGKCPLEKVGISTKTARGYTEKVDAVITSPPYSDIAKSKEGAISPHMQGLISKLSGIPVKEFAHDVTKLKEAVKIAQSKIPFQYSESKDNIGNLPHGNVDAVITSPPYSESLNESKKTTSNLKREERLKTSGHKPKQFFGGTARNCQLEDGLRYSHNPENIGNLKHGEVDAVITSPPYEGSFEGGSRHTGGILEREKSEKETMNAMGEGVKYSDSNEQIGNMKKETYLEAMLKVYSEMHKVLRPQGVAIIVVKPFIRNKKVVDLPWHTWILLEKVGFALTKLYKLRLKNQSFWRILYTKKYPEVPEIKHEYILVATRT